MNSLFFKSPHCYWCGTEVFSSHKVGATHPKCATEDHVRSKPECQWRGEYNHRRNKVLACYACNQRRSDEWVQRERQGLVARTDWSIRTAEKRRANRLRKKIKQEHAQEQWKIVHPVNVVVPLELSEAFNAK